jgi:hypothetical protein
MLGTRILPTGSFLSLTLGNPGQFIHPGLMYGHFRLWRGEQYDEAAIPMLYAGATDETGEIVERLSSEASAVAGALRTRSAGLLSLEHVQPVHDWLRASYGDVTADLSTVATCFRTGPIQARRAPMLEASPGKFVPNFQYRYLTEDVPYGLVVTRALAELVSVDTPTIDAVISWAQLVLNKVYLIGDRLEGPDMADLPTPQNHGIFSVEELIRWYTAEATGRVSASLLDP